FLRAVLVQSVQLPMPWLHSISPPASALLPQLHLAVAAGGVTRHSLSIEPDRTQIGIILFGVNALLLLGCVRLFSIRGARRAAEALAVVGVALALVGMVQNALDSGKAYGFWTAIDDWASPFGPFINRNHFAGWMLMALPMTLGLLCGRIARASRGVKPNWRARLLWFSSPEASYLVLLAAATIVMTLSLVLTMSRSGMTALALSVAITGASVGRRYKRGRRAVAVAYLAVLVLAVG